MAMPAYLLRNARCADPFLFSLTSRGFFSEVNCLLAAMLFGMATRRRLCVDESRFADGAFAWSDLYRSQLPWATAEDRAAIAPDWIITGSESPGLHTIRERVRRWHRRRRFLWGAFGFHPGIFAAQRHLAREFCQPVVPAQPPESLAGPYAAIHVRRGDKTGGYTVGHELVIEGDDVPLAAYVSILRRHAPHLRSVFVMTDDHRVVGDLQASDTGLSICTFCREAEQGYEQGGFDSLDPRSKLVAIRRLICEVEIAARSDLFIGCYKSNVSRYIALTHRHPRRCFSADGLEAWVPA